MGFECGPVSLEGEWSSLFPHFLIWVRPSDAPIPPVVCQLDGLDVSWGRARCERGTPCLSSEFAHHFTPGEDISSVGSSPMAANLWPSLNRKKARPTSYRTQTTSLSLFPNSRMTWKRRVRNVNDSRRVHCPPAEERSLDNRTSVRSSVLPKRYGVYRTFFGCSSLAHIQCALTDRSYEDPSRLSDKNCFANGYTISQK